MKAWLWSQALPAKAAFWLVNAAIALTAAVLVIEPAYTYLGDRQAQVLEQQRLLARLQALVRQGPGIQERTLAESTRTKRVEFVSGPNEGVISAELQSRVQGVAQSAGIRVRSVRSLPAQTRGQVRLAGVRIELFGPIQGIRQAIHAMETATPFLFIGNATVRLTQAANAGSAEPVVDAQLEIFSAIRVEAGS
jgi:general secretion pathway protein M